MSFKNRLTLCGVVSLLLASASPAKGEQPDFNPVWEEYQESAQELRQEWESTSLQMEKDLHRMREEQRKMREDLEAEMEQLHQAYRKTFPRHQAIELRPNLIPPEPRNGIVIQIPPPEPASSKLERLAKKRLSRQEFDQLRQEVKTIDDYLLVLNARQMYYPRKESSEFKYDYHLSYGSPLVTHNRGHGVCEELALYFAAFFIDKPGYELHLFAFDDNKKNVGHAVTVFKDPQNKWGFSDNLEVPSERYSSRKEALSAALIYSSYIPKDTTIFEVRLKPGNWVYEDRVSKRFSRKLLPQ